MMTKENIEKTQTKMKDKSIQECFYLVEFLVGRDVVCCCLPLSLFLSSLIWPCVVFLRALRRRCQKWNGEQKGGQGFLAREKTSQTRIDKTKTTTKKSVATVVATTCLFWRMCSISGELGTADTKAIIIIL